MPIEIPEAAGKPYRPSNGTEGLMFMGQFCDRCKNDNYDEKNYDSGCKLLMNTMLHDIGDPEYPKEWRFDDSGRPECTAFEVVADMD